MIHDEDFHARNHPMSHLATAGSDDDSSEPLLLDQGMNVLNSMLSTVTLEAV